MVNVFKYQTRRSQSGGYDRALPTAMSALTEDVLIYNSLSRTKEVFKPITENKVTFYSCGPTVYDYAHIGNFRAFLTYDVLKRWLLYCGYNVEHVCNLTDIDDKIILKMDQDNKSLEEVTNTYADAFFEDLDVLNIIKAGAYPRATEHIGDIEAMITKLIKKGFAYESQGSVYFRVTEFKDYGRLANRDFNQDEVGAGGFGPNERRGSGDKENARDFVLWKRCGEHEAVGYDSVFGRGRPGWHIECSAMIDKLLGKTIDIHAGGVDLVFPHHQNEIAQSECCSGEPLCKYWVHNGFVNINNEKMSKSLKNFKTLRDIATTANDARAFRFMVVSAQYRGPLNFTPDTLKAAISSLKRIDRVIGRLDKLARGEEAPTAASDTPRKALDLKEVMETSVEAFEKAMCDDMNTPRATAALFSLIGAAEKAMKGGLVDGEAANDVLITIRRMDQVFGILYTVPQSYFTGESAGDSVRASDEAIPLGSLPEEVAALAAARASAKADKDWSAADKARDDLTVLGYRIKDGKDGTYEILRLQ